MDVIITAIAVGFVVSVLVTFSVAFMREYNKISKKQSNVLTDTTVFIRFEEVTQAEYHVVLAFDWIKDKFIGQAESKDAVKAMLFEKFKDKNIVEMVEDGNIKNILQYAKETS